MALVVDNLRIDHRVAVIQDFTDSAGTSMRAGQSGIIRGFSYDQIGRIVHMEIWMESGHESGKVDAGNA